MVSPRLRGAEPPTHNVIAKAHSGSQVATKPPTIINRNVGYTAGAIRSPCAHLGLSGADPSDVAKTQTCRTSLAPGASSCSPLRVKVKVPCGL
jgi:hypothetical protein